MAFSTSGAFRQFFTDYLHNTNAFWTPAMPNLDLETHKVALFGNSVVPDYDALTTLATYNGTSSTWSAANECSGTNYVAKGSALTVTAVSNVAGGISKWDADDTGASSLTPTWTNISVTAYGCLIFADAVTAPANNVDQAILAVAFGGPFTTTLGAFTIQWSGSGIYTLDN